MDHQTAETQDRPRPAPSSPPPSARSGRRRAILVAIGIALLAVIAFALLRPHHNGAGKHKGKNAAVDDSVSPVAITTVANGTMPVSLTELGTVVPITNVTVTPRVNGHIMTVYYQEGQHVKKGDVLELIDPRPYQAAVDQMQGTLDHDMALLAEARVDNARYQRLIAQHSVAAQTARDQEFVVQQYEGQVKTDQGNLETAKLNLYYCKILAPVDGRVGIRALDMGNYVTAGQSGGLTTLTQMQPISVIFTLPQDQLPRVNDRLHAIGALPVEAWNSANLEKIADGTVKALDSQIDTSTGTVRLRAIFPNEDEHLFPNQFVNIHLLVDTLQNVMLLPTNALQTGPNGQFVYVVQPDSTVKVQYVKIGTSDNDHAVIQSGVQLGDKIVTDGTNHLRPGAKVSIQTPHPTTDSGNDSQPAPRHHPHHADQNGQQSETGQSDTQNTDTHNTGNQH